MHDKLIKASVGVEAREKNRAAMVRIGLRENYGMLGAAPHQVHGKFDQGARGRQSRSEPERHLGHPVPAGHHELDEPGIDVDILVPLQGQHVWAI